MALVGQDVRDVSLEQLVHECTNDILNEPDYSKQLDIVERVQAFGKSVLMQRCIEVAEALMARIDKKRKSENAIYLCIHLADFLIKNLQPEMPTVLAQDTYQKTIVKLAKGKTLKGKAQVLLTCKVQEWSYLFQNLRGFQETYITLQKSGMEFPPPSRELMEEQSRANQRRINVAAERKRLADPHRKLKDSVALLQSNVRLVIDMLAAVDPVREDVRQSELIPPLLDSIGKQRPRITELIATATDEELMGMLLVVNDDINNAFEWYQQLLAGVRPTIPQAAAAAAASSSPVTAATAVPDRPRRSSQQRRSSEQRRSPSPDSPPRERNDGRQPALVLQATPPSEDPFAALARSRKARASGATPPAAGPPVSSLDALFATPAPGAAPLSPTITYVPSSAMMDLSGSTTSASPSGLYAQQPPPVATPANPFLAMPANSSSSSTLYGSGGLYGGGAPQAVASPPSTPFDVFLLSPAGSSSTTLGGGGGGGALQAPALSNPYAAAPVAYGGGPAAYPASPFSAPQPQQQPLNFSGQPYALYQSPPPAQAPPPQQHAWQPQ